MKHTEDLHIQHKVNEACTKNTLKTENRRNRASPWRTRSTVDTAKRVSEAALKRLERDREETGAAQEAQRELEE